MKKAALHNLGCKVNSYETEAMQQLLEDAGYQIVPFQDEADVYVVNTCTVTNIADRKSRQMQHPARKKNPDSIIVAAGCYVQTAGEKLLQDGTVDIFLGNNRKKELVQLLQAFEKEKEKEAVMDLEDLNQGTQEYESLHMTKTSEHTRAFIKVQDGCNQFCSYCIIPYARGRVRSRTVEDVLEEISSLSKKGYQEVVLTGIHLSSYGIDFGDSLLHLIREVHQIPGISRIRLGSLAPMAVTEEFARTLAGLDKFCPHFHLSLQSGCDATLKRMNRHYTTNEYEKRCGLLRQYFIQPAITTDVIVGFPGETEEEFLQTKSFLERIRFAEMHIFKYSKRQGTRAASMEGQVAEEIKTKRSAELLELEKQLSYEYRSSFIGRKAEVLLEEPMEYQGKNYYTGYTKEYIKIAVETEKNLSNKRIFGKITKALTDDIHLMVEFSDRLY